MSAQQDPQEIFDPKTLQEMFPPGRSDAFFEALYGDSSEGAYDIAPVFKQQRDGQLVFELQLRQRPGKCLACNLTYGLPQVFSRHPVIDIKGFAADVCHKLGLDPAAADVSLGRTREISRELHVMEVVISLPS